MPTPTGIASVSPWMTVTLAMGMLSSDWTSMAQAVWWPWPCAELPVYTVAEPSWCTTRRAVSPAAASAAVIST